MASVVAQIQDLQRQLGKKATFEAAAKELASMVEKEYGKADSASRKALFTAASRAATVLQTRYTSQGLWRVGHRLFTALEAATAAPEEKRYMAECVAKAEEHLAAEDLEELRAQRQGSRFLFEGQLSGAAAPSRPLSSPENVLNMLLSGFLAQQETADVPEDMEEDTSQFPSTSSTSQQGNEGPPLSSQQADPGEPVAGEGSNQVVDPGGSNQGRLQPDQSSSSQGDQPPVAGDPTVLEAAIRRAEAAEAADAQRRASRLPSAEGGERPSELVRAIQQALEGLQEGAGTFVGLEEALAASVNEQQARPAGPPPASKAVVKKLPVIAVTEEQLQAFGKGSECAVCREELQVGDGMQQLPCNHLFHPPCLAPWLAMHNSCPVCRFELPTDDHVYESRKEREKEVEEERKGAANAVREGQFMYL